MSPLPPSPPLLSERSCSLLSTISPWWQTALKVFSLFAVAISLAVFFFKSIPSSFRSSSLSKKESNILFFKETLDRLRKNPLPPSKGKIYTHPKFSRSDRKQPLPSIEISNCDTLQAVVSLQKQGKKPVFLIMANATSPGGSVWDGSEAQEESICRHTNAYPILKRAEAEKLYPLPELGGLYFKTYILRDQKGNWISPIETFAFATAAYNCNKSHVKNGILSGYDEPPSKQEYERGMLSKMASLCDAAEANGHDAVVLSALGCGAFHNDPKTVAGLWKKALQNRAFKKVVFAILDSKGKNIKAFQEVFQNDPS